MPDEEKDDELAQFILNKHAMELDSGKQDSSISKFIPFDLFLLVRTP